MALMTLSLQNFVIALINIGILSLIALMSLSKWKSPFKWNLLIPHELRGLTETVFSPCVCRFHFDMY